MSGRWLLRLYPRAWRERYGEEMCAMLADIPLTPASILDLVAGAIDARVTPQPIQGPQAAVPSEKEKAMFTKMMKSCALGPDVTPQDRWLGSTVMLAASLVFAGLYILASWLYRDNALVDAFGIMAFPAALLLAMPYTQLKGHSRASKIVIVGGLLSFLAFCSFVAAKI